MDSRRVIMYVDDDPDLSTLVGEVLSDRYTVVPMATGSAAWRALQTGLKPHLIVLDLHLPGLNGYRLIANIRSMPRLADVPIALLSGDEMIVDIAASLGIPHALSKPCSSAELLKFVADALGQ
jgi:CheY-like chemotaxis protein